MFKLAYFIGLFITLCLVTACQSDVNTSIPFDPAYLQNLPGAFVYETELKDAPYPYEKYTPHSNQLQFLTSRQAKGYSLGKSTLRSPNKHYEVKWIDAVGNISVIGGRFTNVPPAPELPVIFNTRTKEKHFLNLDNYKRSPRDDYHWAPDNSHLLYALAYEDDYGDSGIDYLFIIQNTRTGKAYRLFQKPRGNIQITWVEN